MPSTRVEEKDQHQGSYGEYLRAAVILGGGIAFSLILIILGYVVNKNLQTTDIPSQQNEYVLAFTLVFLGLITGYNIAKSFTEGELKSVFFIGFFSPLILLELISNIDWPLKTLMLLGAFAPFALIVTGFTSENQTWDSLLNWIANYIPNIWIVTIIIGNITYSPLGESIYAYVIGLICSVVLKTIVIVYNEW